MEPARPRYSDVPRWRRPLGLLALFLRPVQQWITVALRRLLDRWRASLQFRVVGVTMALCMVVMLVLQGLIYQRIADGLVEARIASAQQDALQSAHYLQQQLSSTDKKEPAEIWQVVSDAVRSQETRTEDGPSRQLLLTRSLTTPGGAIPMSMGGEVDAALVPAELHAALDADPRHQQVQVVPSGPGRSAPTLLVGSRWNIPRLGDHDLFYVFPLDREQRSLDMVRQTFLLGVVVFVLLMGLVVALVTRLAVDPIREAAVVAGRISSGRLNERMHVRGTDDLAKLAMSFNGMADHLQEQIRQLEDLSRVQQRFVSDVSHELRTPLTTIRMAAELIHEERQNFSAAAGRSAELLHAELDRFEALLADLLEISRFDAGAAILEREDTDLRVIAQRVVRDVHALAQRTSTDLILLGADQPRRADVDARRVERIVRNLVVNALDYGEGRPVIVELGSSETAVAIAVRDFGVGLRPGEADLVFHRFWRADPARNRTSGGTGLGLAISLEDARLHDGWLHAWGEPENGSRFRLTLPRHAGRPIGYPPLPLMDPDAELAAGPAVTIAPPSPGLADAASGGIPVVPIMRDPSAAERPWLQDPS